MKRLILLSALCVLSSALPLWAVVPPSTSLELTSTQEIARDSKDPRYQVIPVQTILKVDRVTGKIWILEPAKDGDPQQTHWVEYPKDQPGWTNIPR